MRLPPASHADHTAHSCHWSVPTILMPRPYWLSASDASWCCWNNQDIWVLTSTEGCHVCPLWKPRGHPHEEDAAMRPKGAVPLQHDGY